MIGLVERWEELNRSGQSRDPHHPHEKANDHRPDRAAPDHMESDRHGVVANTV